MRRLSRELFYSIHPTTYLAISILLFMVPIPWVAAWLLAGFVHELGHYLSIALFGKRIYGIRINWNGIILDTEDLGSVQWICALAGPLFGAMLIPFYRWIPRLAVCALVQSGINLLPVFPADGGRFVFGILSLWLPNRIALRITSSITYATLLLLALAALYMLLCFSIKVFSVFLLFVILAKFTRVRLSCKEERLLVQ